MYPKFSKRTFDNIVTGDENWMYYFEPKRKNANRIWATKMPDAQVLPNEYEFCMLFFTNNGPAIHIPVPKGRTVTGKFYKNVVPRKMKTYYRSRRPKTGLKYVRLLHDNAPAHKACIVTDFLESEKVTVLLHPPFCQTWSP